VADLLADDITMDTATLHVDDLTSMVAYYRDALGLTVIDDAKGVVRLGRGTTAGGTTAHRACRHPAVGRQAGLFHTRAVVSRRCRCGPHTRLGGHGRPALAHR